MPSDFANVPGYSNIIRCTVVGLQGPSGSSAIDDTSVSPRNVWSSNKVSDEISKVVQDKYYEHIQTLPSMSWTVQHNLGKVPSIVILNTQGVQFDSLAYQLIHNKDVNGKYNSATIIFPSEQDGSAHCN